MRRRHWATFGFLAIIGLLLGVFHNHRVSQKRPDPVTGFVRAVVIPIQSGVRNTTDGVSGLFNTLFRARRAIAEHEQLLAENQRLRIALAQTDALQRENEELNRLLRLRSQLRGEWIASRIIVSYLQMGDYTLTLDKGTEDGIQVGAPVVAGEGLVGVVTETGRHNAQVRLLTASRVAVSAYVENPAKRSAGICEGQDESSLRLNYLPLNAPVQIGDRIVSAGLGGKYPPGIPIGVVEQVREDRRYSVKQAQVRPSVSFEQLEMVLVFKF